MWRLIVMYGVLVPEAALFILFKHKSRKKEQDNIVKTLSVVIKALCTTTILITAVMGIPLVEAGASAYVVLVVAGISLGLAGDVAICNDFLAGMMLFGLGHGCYIAAYLQISEHPVWSLPLLAVLYGLFLFVLRKKLIPPNNPGEPGKTASAGFRAGTGGISFNQNERQDITSYRVPVMLYGFIILAMLSLAATLPFSAPSGGLTLLAGAVLFVVSDALLAFNTFGRYNGVLDVVSLYSYFIAQSLFAVSIYIYA